MIWEDTTISGFALRHTYVDRDHQPAVDEARKRTREVGLYDEREEVLLSWNAAGTWMRPPVVVAGEIIGTAISYELLVGFTRLGNLLGFLDRAEIEETRRHRCWLGRLLRGRCGE